MNPRLIAIGQTLGIVLAGSFAGVLAKLALRDVSAFTFVWLQLGIGGALLTLYTFWWRGERIPRGLGRAVWVYLVCIGVGNFTIVRVMLALALERLPATTLTYLVNFVGFVTMLMSVFLLKERPSSLQVGGAALAVLGLWVFFPEVPAPAEMTGVVYAGVAVVALALTNNLARKLAIVTRKGLSNNVISTVAFWVGGVPVVLAGLAVEPVPAVDRWQNWGIIVLSAVVSIAIGMTVWNYVLRTLRSYEASVLGASTVIFTALYAVPILGERLAWHQITGIAMMMAGLVLSQLRRGVRESLSRRGVRSTS